MEKVSKKAFLEKATSKRAMIVYDLETTGLSPEDNHIIEIGARYLIEDGSGGFDEVDSKIWYINPGYKLPEIITELTGITDEFLADKPTEAEVFDEVEAYFSNEVVCGYNNWAFDDLFMAEMYGRRGKCFEPSDSLDLYAIVPQVLSPKDTANYKLKTISEVFGFAGASDKFHDSADDSMFTAKCLNKVLDLCRKQPSDSYECLLSCIVMSITYWEGNYHDTHLKRIYIGTNRACFWFDPEKLTWNTKSPRDDINRYDIEDVKEQVYVLTGYKNDSEFARFRGKYQYK